MRSIYIVLDRPIIALAIASVIVCIAAYNLAKDFKEENLR